jgi:hypothetical protein
MTLVVATALAHDIHLLAYDWFVQRHNQTVVGAALRTEFAKSLPKNVWDRHSRTRNEEERKKASALKVSLTESVLLSPYLSLTMQMNRYRRC